MKVVGRYYPSEIGYCLRKVWYSYKDPKPVYMDLIKIFEVGNILHDFVAEVLRSEKNPHVELLDSEFPFQLNLKDFTISGRVDDLLLVKENGEKFLVEVKSTNRIDLVEKPQPHHVMQLQLYMHVIGIHKGFMLYIEKSTLKTKSFPIDYKEGVAAEALWRFQLLHKHLQENKLPEPEAKREAEKNWMCKNCAWYERCAKES